MEVNGYNFMPPAALPPERTRALIEKAGRVFEQGLVVFEERKIRSTWESNPGSCSM
jgi:hypothetical protein